MPLSARYELPAPSPVLPSGGGRAPNPSVRGAARPLLLAGRDPGPPRLQTRDASARRELGDPRAHSASRPSPARRHLGHVGDHPPPPRRTHPLGPTWGGSGRRVCLAPRGSPSPPPRSPGRREGGPLVKSEPGLRMKESRCPCVAGRRGWPAVQTTVVGALTFRGRRQSPCRWPARRPARSCARGPQQPAGRRPEGAVCVGGAGAGGGARREDRAGPAHKGAPAAAPRRTMQPRGAGGCAALQLPLHSEACKRAHLILNPLRRSPCEPGRGWPSEPLQPQAWSPGARRAVCSAHANGAGVLETWAESAG